MFSELLNKKHSRYFRLILQMIPEKGESSRMTLAFFAISGLDLLDSLDDNGVRGEKLKKEAIDWIYRLQIKGAGPKSGFKASTMLPEEVRKYQCGHLAMTYTGLATLLILGDDLSGVDKNSIVEGIRACQNPDGSFTASVTGCESDMRFVYCACCVSTILDDWSGMDKCKAIDYILQSIVSMYFLTSKFINIF